MHSRKRRIAMGKMAAVLVLAFGLCVTGAAPATAAPSLSTTASELRTQVSGLMRGYERRYGPRISADQRVFLRSVTREAHREMNSLVRSVRSAERSDLPSDWSRAHTRYVEIRSTGDQRLAEVGDVLAPEMSFTEQLDAWSQARSVMQDLDSLGAQLERRAR